MIRQCVKNIIFESLNYDIFRFEDFTVKESNHYSDDRICISYLDYYYQIDLNEESCNIVYNPGYVLTVENDEIVISNFEKEIRPSVRYWLDRVKRDLLNPLQERFIVQTLKDFKKELDKKLAEIKDEESFSKEEKEALKERLDMLEKIILDNASENNDLKAEIKKMKQELDFLKVTVDTLSKKKWLKNAITKMYTWSQQAENKKLIEAGADVIKKISQIDFPNMNQ